MGSNKLRSDRAPKAGGKARRRTPTAPKVPTRTRARGRSLSDRIGGAEAPPPDYDADVAAVFAKCLNAGVPPHQAVAYIRPGLSIETCLKIAKGWMNDVLTVRAINRLNGGEWPDLDPEKRFRLAKDKTLSEMAFYLMTHNFNELNGDDLKKAKEAREALQAELKGTHDEDDPLAAFARLAADTLKAARRPSAPQLASVPAPGAPSSRTGAGEAPPARELES